MLRHLWKKLRLVEDGRFLDFFARVGCREPLPIIIRDNGKERVQNCFLLAQDFVYFFSYLQTSLQKLIFNTHHHHNVFYAPKFCFLKILNSSGEKIAFRYQGGAKNDYKTIHFVHVTQNSEGFQPPLLQKSAKNVS